MLAARQRLSLAVLVALSAGAGGCDRRRTDGPGAVGDSAVPSASTATVSSVATSVGGGRERPSVPRDDGPVTPPPSGGPWASCADGFRISGNPLRDVTRLGLLCGPSTGMRRPDPPLERSLTPNEPWTFDVPLIAGECLRLMAASSTAAPLSLSTNGAPGLLSDVATDEGWLITRRQGPLCAHDNATAHVVVTAAGGGNVAVGRWFLPP